MSNPSHARVLLFDIDGTLISCGGLGRRAMEEAFRQHVGDASVVDFPFGGRTDRSIAREGLGRAGRTPTIDAIDAVLTLYLATLERELALDAAGSAPLFEVLPAVVETLQALAVASTTRPLAIGLGTGNVVEGARLKLGRVGLWEHFAFGGFGSDEEDRSKLLATGQARGRARLGIEDADVLVIGDTLRDIDAAHAIGARCLAVATGPATVDELRAHGADEVVESLREVSLEWLIGR